MRLFHASEESGIELFLPRVPTRADAGSEGLVWAINERCLPNFLTPRDCPRVTYHAAKNSTLQDLAKFFSNPKSQRHLVAIEQAWFERMAQTCLYLYEFNPADFELQDAVAGFYIAKKAQKPTRVTKIDDLFKALFDRNVELRILDNMGFRRSCAKFHTKGNLH
jgi:hypothetical protein